MLTKCICTNCAGHLEFEEGNEGERIACPHCGFETTLYLPGMEPIDNLETAPRWRQWIANRKIQAVAGLVLIAAILFALYHWGVPWIQDYTGWETRFGSMVLLLLLCAALPFALLWLAFPLLIFLQMRRQTRLLSQLAAWTTSLSTGSSETSAETFTEPDEAPESPETGATASGEEPDQVKG